MKKLLILFLIPIFLLAGCSSGGGSDETTKSIQVLWENQDSSSASGMIAGLLTDFRPLQIAQTADIQLDGERFTQTPTPLGYTVSHVKADLFENGAKVNNAKFDFAFEKSGNIKAQGDDYVDVIFDTPGTGTVNVKHDTLTKKVTFHVMAAAIVDNIVDFGNSKPGFDFEAGQEADEVEAVIVMGTRREVISKYPYAKIPRSGYWEEYYNISDVTGLTYQPAGQMWGPDVNSTEPFNYNYAFEIYNGYAKMMVNHYQNRGGDAWGFVYDYSPDGTF